MRAIGLADSDHHRGVGVNVSTTELIEHMNRRAERLHSVQPSMSVLDLLRLIMLALRGDTPHRYPLGPKRPPLRIR